MEGIIVKGIAGFYYVQTEELLYQCKARGIFRKKGVTPFVGDHVRITLTENNEAMIDEIFPRKNEFIRPPVANVDLFIIVVSVTRPEPNLSIIDKFLVMAEQEHTDIAVCFNKVDLAKENELTRLTDIYEGLYPLVLTSSKTGRGIPELKKMLAGKTSALAGPSGVGKSTLLNLITQEESAETGEIGDKSKRGKHTTRHVELFKIDGNGFLFDTPGFTSFEVLDAKEDQLAFLYPEMQPYIGKCRYDNCRHLSEPACAVREALDQGKIHPSRYASYKDQMLEIQKMRKY
ncbi:MAG: ribosome small subunit-dependent GTPase A [Eubacteriales bacterium]|nr:ribosome small subunit-dependent GTPase A [Eubacteriales bacterium]MDD3350224.1 ribosome small subunit-dependent GTPase A [Eubacteriales bacterium]